MALKERDVLKKLIVPTLFVADANRLRQEDTLTDFEIVCGSRTWKVHQAVLAMHSDVLLKTCSGGFKESPERKLVLSVHDPATVDRLITYMYTLDYDITARGGETRTYAYALLAGDLDFVKLNTVSVCKTIEALYEGPPSTMSDHLINKLVALSVSSGDIIDPFLDLIEQFPAFRKGVVTGMAKNKLKRIPGERRCTCPSPFCDAKFRAAIAPGTNTVACWSCRTTFSMANWDTLAMDE